MLPIIAGLIGSAAPLVASFFSSDKQSVVNKGLDLVGSVLGVPPKEDAITAALRADPAAITKLREYEMREYVQLSMERVDMERLYVENVQGARQMAMSSDEVIKLQRQAVRDNTWMLAGAVMGVFALISFRPEVFKQYPEITNILYVIITALVMGNREITGFLFGSSIQSRSQDTLPSLTKTAHKPGILSSLTARK